MPIYGRTITINRNVAGSYNFYCRACGRIHEQDECPDLCKYCGSILNGCVGFGISGDTLTDGRTDGTISEDLGARGRYIRDIQNPVK